jgi:DNA-binding response OmpR family regulator
MRAATGATLDLLVADVSLPGPNGCELAARILETQPDMQVLFISGYTGAEACRAYGIQSSDAHFLGKPFDPATLLARVDELLKEPSDHRSSFTRNMRPFA